MKYFYSKWGDTTLTHSDMQSTDTGNRVDVYFERPNDTGGFDFAEGSLPLCDFSRSYGFSEDELLWLQGYLKNNAMLIWDYSQKGGALNA